MVSFSPPSVIIRDLHEICVIFFSAPNETDTPLVVNPDAVLAFSVTPQSFQVVARNCCQVSQYSGRIKHVQLPAANVLNGLKSFNPFALEQALSGSIRERFNHAPRV